MVALKLMNFGGMIPTLDDRLLPQNNAAYSQNTWLYDGSLRGLPSPVVVHTLSNPDAQKVFRVPITRWGRDNIEDSYWLEFTSQDMDVIPSVLASDSYERFYWAGLGTEPRYNTKARIGTSSASFILGIPAPTVAPGLSVVGGAGPTETRAYVYTWVSEYGEEGPPSPPTVLAGNSDGSWNLTFTAPGAAATDRNLTHTRVYRTITGSTGSTTYYLVTEITIATLAHNDTAATTDVAMNNILESTYWSGPPSDLAGLTALPNGIIAGWRGNEVWFCEPYRPHAWPTSYTVVVDGDIVGFGSFGQTLIVCTNISPYAVSGVDPASMSISQIGANEPCLSRGSIVSTLNGVAYASQNGIVSVTPGGARLATSELIAKEDWLNNEDFLQISTIRASLLGEAYYCWCAPGTGSFESTAFESTAFTQTDYTGAYSGALIDIQSAKAGYTQLLSTSITPNCFTDSWTGEIFLIRDGTVQWLDMSPVRERQEYVWKSKILETPNQRNFQAMRIYFQNPAGGGGSTFTNNWWDDTETWDDSLVWNDGEAYGTVRMYADGNLRYTNTFRSSGDIMRLPSGFKATYWQIEIQSIVPVYSVEIATSMLELGSV